ncbi:hypothetical protein [Streptomyces anulatus]|uniref:hypothetical protein n=1 Tax=Streptomyces anulatus TaxID=1892 RepID=UPI00331CE11A
MSAPQDQSNVDLSAVPVEQLLFLQSQQPATQEDRRWAKMAEEARFSGLADVQRSAERWGATILVITGLLTTLTVARGASDLAALQDLWPGKIAVGGLAAIALLISIASVVYAAMAAQGQPVEMVVSGPNYEKATMEATRKANDKLKTSRRLALAVVPFYMAALGFMAYAPQAKNEPPKVSVTDSTGGTYCGISTKQVKGNLVIAGEKGDVATVPLARVEKVSAVEKCSEGK